MLLQPFHGKLASFAMRIIILLSALKIATQYVFLNMPFATLSQVMIHFPTGDEVQQEAAAVGALSWEGPWLPHGTQSVPLGGSRGKTYFSSPGSL